MSWLQAGLYSFRLSLYSYDLLDLLCNILFLVNFDLIMLFISYKSNSFVLRHRSYNKIHGKEGFISS